MTQTFNPSGCFALAALIPLIAACAPEEGRLDLCMEGDASLNDPNRIDTALDVQGTILSAGVNPAYGADTTCQGRSQQHLSFETEDGGVLFVGFTLQSGSGLVIGPSIAFPVGGAARLRLYEVYGETISESRAALLDDAEGLLLALSVDMDLPAMDPAALAEVGIAVSAGAVYREVREDGGVRAFTALDVTAEGETLSLEPVAFGALDVGGQSIEAWALRSYTFASAPDYDDYFDEVHWVLGRQ